MYIGQTRERVQRWIDISAEALIGGKWVGYCNCWNCAVNRYFGLETMLPDMANARFSFAEGALDAAMMTVEPDFIALTVDGKDWYPPMLRATRGRALGTNDPRVIAAAKEIP